MANGHQYDFAVDIWSLGILTYEMVTGYSPFEGSETEIFEKIKSYQNLSEIKERLVQVNASEMLLDFLGKILTSDVNKRVQIDGILIHPWLVRN